MGQGKIRMVTREGRANHANAICAAWERSSRRVVA